MINSIIHPFFLVSSVPQVLFVSISPTRSLNSLFLDFSFTWQQVLFISPSTNPKLQLRSLPKTFHTTPSSDLYLHSGHNTLFSMCRSVQSLINAHFHNTLRQPAFHHTYIILMSNTPPLSYPIQLFSCPQLTRCSFESLPCSWLNCNVLYCISSYFPALS